MVTPLAAAVIIHHMLPNIGSAPSARSGMGLRRAVTGGEVTYVRQMRSRYDRRPDDDPPMPAAQHAPWLDEQLFGRRMVFLRGPIEPEMASRAAATLLALDATGTDPITLHLSAEGGSLTAVWTLVDALDAVRSPVHATA